MNLHVYIGVVCGIQNRQWKYMCLKEIGLRAQKFKINQDSVVNVFEGA